MGFLSSIAKAVLPAAGAAIGGAVGGPVGASLGKKAGSAVSGAITSHGASKAANAASAAAQLSSQQIQKLMDDLGGISTKLTDDAAFNRTEGDKLMEGFYQAIADQQRNQDYLRGRNTSNDALALGARDYERGYDAYNSGQVADEYATRYAQLLDDRRTAELERLRDVQNKDRILTNTQGMRDAITRALASAGSLTAPALNGQREVDAEASKRFDVYKTALDKISEGQLSQVEAGLMRRGVDAGGSADATQIRAETAARLASEYAKANLQAQGEAQSIIDTRNKGLTDQYELYKDARARGLSEATAPYSAGLELEASLNPAVTAIMSRDIGSAGYRGTSSTGINQAFVDPGYLDSRTIASLASNSRTRTSQDLTGAIDALSRALSGAGNKYNTDSTAASNTGTAAGLAAARNGAEWGNVASAVTDWLGKKKGGSGVSASESWGI